MSSDGKDATRLAFAKYASYGKKLDRAIGAATAGGVKVHRFHPSGRVILTVVGHLGDEFIDPDKPYCSCSHFFFRVLSGRDELCYHLLSYKIAVESNSVKFVDFDDEEYGQFFSSLVTDVFGVLDRSSGP